MIDARIGYAFTGSFCTFEKSMAALEETAGRFRTVTAIFSHQAAETDTRFGAAADFLARAESITGHAPLCSIREVEPIGPKHLLDALVICPCTGNTLAKLANGIADTPVAMAAKSHLRNGRPVIVAVSTNDGLAGAARNIGELLARRHYYFVPFRQDDPAEKPTSLVADFSLVADTVAAALEGRQLQPLLLPHT